MAAPTTIEEIFSHHRRAMDQVFQLERFDGLVRVNNMISDLQVVSLFSGLGGAELLFRNIYEAAHRKSLECQIPLPTPPQSTINFRKISLLALLAIVIH